MSFEADERAIRRFLLGLGFDKPEDGILHVTRGENFHLVGGSKPTHENMQEICVRFNEEARRRFKTLDQLTPEEFRDIALSLGLRPHPHGRF